MATAGRAGTNPSLTKKGMGIVDGWPLEVADESPRALRKAIQMLLDLSALHWCHWFRY